MTYKKRAFVLSKKEACVTFSSGNVIVLMKKVLNIIIYPFVRGDRLIYIKMKIIIFRRDNERVRNMQ